MLILHWGKISCWLLSNLAWSHQKCWKKLVVLDLFQLLLPAKKCLFLPFVFVNFGNHTASDSWWVMHVKWDAVSFCWNIENTKVSFNKFHLRGMNVCMAWGPLVFMPITKSNTSKGKGENEVWCTGRLH